MMDLFDWRATGQRNAIALGLILSACWAAQHPLQGPLYKALGQDTDGFLEVLMYAEIVVAPLYLLLFLSPSVRMGTREIGRNRLARHLLVPPLIGICGLSLYALGQTQVDGTQVSIILSASPAAMLLFIYLNHNYRMRDALRDAISSRVVYVHVFLVAVVAVLTWIGSGQGSKPFNWLHAAMILLVPGFYFGASSYTRRRFGSSYHMHLAAVAITSIGGATVFAVALLCYLLGKGHQLRFFDIRTDIIAMFVIGGIVASFLGLIVYHLNLRQPEVIQKEISVTTHITPFFAVIIAFLASRLVIDLQIAPNYYQLFSAIFVFLGLNYMSKHYRGG